MLDVNVRRVGLLLVLFPLLSFVILVLSSSVPYSPQHREDLALSGETGMRGVMRPRQRVLVRALKGIVTTGVQRTDEGFARDVLQAARPVWSSRLGAKSLAIAGPLRNP